MTITRGYPGKNFNVAWVGKQIFKVRSGRMILLPSLPGPNYPKNWYKNVNTVYRYASKRGYHVTGKGEFYYAYGPPGQMV